MCIYTYYIHYTYTRYYAILYVYDNKTNTSMYTLI